MGTSPITKLNFINRLQEKRAVLFTPHDVVKIFTLDSENTLKHLLLRLRKEKVIEQLSKGKYVFLHAKREPSDYEIANFMVQPSYVSLETALNFYGLLNQFSYTVTSITIKKTQKVECRGKTFSYSKIKKEYFKGFTKQNNFLMATPEKAVFDFAYFAYNGLRSQGTLSDILANTDSKKFNVYLKENAQGKFLKFIDKYA